jgi:hypothetical protein
VVTVIAGDQQPMLITLWRSIDRHYVVSHNAKPCRSERGVDWQRLRHLASSFRATGHQRGEPRSRARMPSGTSPLGARQQRDGAVPGQ